MWKIKVCFVSLLLSACAHSDDRSLEKPTNLCATRVVKNLQGQIRYFDGMNLIIPGCKRYGNSEFNFYNAEALRKVTANVEFRTRQAEFQYVDVTFSGYVNWRGKLVIKSVQFAEAATEIIF